MQKFYSLSKLLRFLIITILAALLIFIGFIFDIQGLLYDLHSLQKNKIFLLRQLDKTQRRITGLNSLPAQIIKLRDENTKAQKPLINAANTAVLLQCIVNVARNGQVKLLNLQPLKIEFDGQFNTLPIHIALAGDYYSTLYFIESLIGLPYIIILKDIRVNKSQEKSAALVTEMALIVYSTKKDSVDAQK